VPSVTAMRALTVVIFAGTLFGGESSPAEKASDAAKQAMDLARRARATAEMDYYDRAESLVRKSLELAPDNFEALKVRCWILLGKHEFDEARKLAKKLNARMPDDPMPYGFLVDANAELGNYKEAEESAQWMLDLSRNGIPALTRTAYLREVFGDIEGALELMRAAYTRINPAETEDRAWTLVQTAHLLSVSGKLDEAEATLAEALKLQPDYHYALAALAKVHTLKGDAEAAVKLMRRRYELAPHPENLFDVAAALHAAGKRDEAMETFRKFEGLALAESEGWDNANRELITWYADYADKPEEALKIARREIARRQDVLTLDAYAWALYRSGKFTEANEAVSKALAVGTTDPRILSHARAITSHQ
jgi:tetratricopeptide (TPR) repeat protein